MKYRFAYLDFSWWGCRRDMKSPLPLWLGCWVLITPTPAGLVLVNGECAVTRESSVMGLVAVAWTPSRAAVHVRRPADRCTIKMQLLSANQKSTTEELQSTPPPSRAQRADLPWQLALRSEFMLNM